MATRIDSLSRYLAHNLGAMRAARSMTQADLARAAALPRSTVTNLESGAGNPSLASLAALSEALQVTIEELLAKPRADCQLVRAKDLGAKTYDSARVRIVKLLPDPIAGLEIDRMDLTPGGWKQGVPHLVGTREYFTCVSGSVSVFVAGEQYRIEAGDVLAFPGDQAHSYRNTGERSAVCFSVVALAARRRRR
jgi:transcriptional regulator with XRE-family HTH domain